MSNDEEKHFTKQLIVRRIDAMANEVRYMSEYELEKKIHKGSFRMELNQFCNSEQAKFKITISIQKISDK